MSDSTDHKEPKEVIQQPQPSHQQPHTFNTDTDSEFDPCLHAVLTRQITSPFYLYNHDSPRPSFDVKNTSHSRVAIHDLESGVNLSPSITQEKRDAQKKKPSHAFKFWEKKQGCLTKPRKRGCLSSLPPRQRLLVKILIGLAIIGAAVGIAVGISIRVGGGVWKDDNSTSTIG